ncbi:hypothetical protein EPUS_04903 [Endocarpon pusillum Z07020]|uniref:Uncharacterized protein n=1 Tax=Endocarpon pusillum (strain Z07020 / HMAS-L-300199) TaxID=1263415 RepID=U1HYY3_ENDPU|nr:uncharacterized protein EPUS_04903 [Endocarpon pusillum Z07020]ERF74734.1 hypothetical protein EPUS_04903 [Endocarpon pusillum Z07020]
MPAPAPALSDEPAAGKAGGDSDDAGDVNEEDGEDEEDAEDKYNDVDGPDRDVGVDDTDVITVSGPVATTMVVLTSTDVTAGGKIKPGMDVDAPCSLEAVAIGKVEAPMGERVVTSVIKIIGALVGSERDMLTYNENKFL